MQLKWRLAHTRGYLELGLVKEAAAELDQVAPEDAEHPDVLGLRACILQEQKDWPALEIVARRMAGVMPQEVSWWITWAYAARRARTLATADAILREAERLHPGEAIIQFNLGCYACQRGDLIEAKGRVARAIQLDAHFRECAVSDPDLAPLRDAQLLP